MLTDLARRGAGLRANCGRKERGISHAINASFGMQIGPMPQLDLEPRDIICFGCGGDEFREMGQSPADMRPRATTEQIHHRRASDRERFDSIALALFARERLELRPDLEEAGLVRSGFGARCQTFELDAPPSEEILDLLGMQSLSKASDAGIANGRSSRGSIDRMVTEEAFDLSGASRRHTQPAQCALGRCPFQ